MPVSFVHNIAELVEQEQAKAREAIIPVMGLERVKSAGIPIKFSRTPGRIHKSPPTLGEDTDSVLRRLGIPEGELSRLRSDGVVR